MYICKDFNGNWFKASKGLAAALDRETVRAPVNVPLALTVKVRRDKDGTRSATCGKYCLTSYADGDYSVSVNSPVLGFVHATARDVPEDEHRAMCFALGIRYGENCINV